MGPRHRSLHCFWRLGWIVSRFIRAPMTSLLTLVISSGWLLWTCFMGLDSYEFPCKNYADLAFRVYGRVFRHIVNFLQSLQLLLSVGNIVISNGQALSQVSQFKLCYAVCCLLWALCGFGLGQVRTLQKFGILANCAVFLNLLIMFITMGVMAHSPPNYAIAVLGSAGSALGYTDTYLPYANGSYPAVIHYNGLPDNGNFIGALNGLSQGVYAYAGAQLFIEFMAEMKRPRDFLKAMWGAQFFIYTCYMIYGCYVYFWQGQYSYQVGYLHSHFLAVTFSPSRSKASTNESFQISYQGVSPYGWQVVGNMLGITSGLIAAALYGNIGIKVLYNNIFMEWFHAPSLLTSRGKMLWACIVPIYWTIAFILAAAIPDFVGLTGLTAALCFVQFTYTFPPMLAFGYLIQKNALQPGEGFDPVTGQVVYHDRGVKRWIRGFFAKRWYLNLWHILYAGGALALSGLGSYAAIENMIFAFTIPQVNAFSCQSPLNLNS
jgi:hypothetical protein